MYQRTDYCSSAVRGPGPKAWAVQRALSQIKNPPADYKITKALIALGNGHFRNFLCHSAACASLAASTATAARGYLACQPAWHQQYPSMLLPYGQRVTQHRPKVDSSASISAPRTAKRLQVASVQTTLHTATESGSSCGTCLATAATLRC